MCTWQPLRCSILLAHQTPGMQLIPKESLTYRSKHAPDTVVEMLEELIDPPQTITLKMPFTKPDGKPYAGSWGEDDRTFSVVRKINHRNSFLPRIKGSIEPDGTGTIVHISMRMPLLVRLFIAFWFCGVSFAFVTSLSNAIREGNWGWWVWMPLGMLAFLLIIVNYGFRTESAKSKKHLAQLFETSAEA